MAQATRLLDGINEMKIGGDMTDFTVKVGTTAFDVHRLVLAVSSPYFRAMLSHNMKEALEGEVIMQGLSANAVGTCIQFMYTGEVDLKMKEVADVLYAATFMQLDLIVAVCSDYLDGNIDKNAVLHIRELARAYDFAELAEKSQKFIQCNLTEVSSTSSFYDLPVDDMAECTITPDTCTEVAWTAVMNWVRFDREGRTKHLEKLLRLLSAHTDNIENVILSTWANEEVKKSKECQFILQERLMKLTPDEIILLKKDICCQVKSILRNCEMGDTFMINEAMHKLLVRNFEEISSKKEFNDLLYGDFGRVLQESECSSSVKWGAILKWTKHDKRRKKRFPELLRMLDFSAFTVDFIQNTVRQEALVKESTESMMLLLDVLASKLRTANENEAGNGSQRLNPTPISAEAVETQIVELVENVSLEKGCVSGEEMAKNTTNGESNVQQRVESPLEKVFSENSDNISKEQDEDVHDLALFDGQSYSSRSNYPHESNFWSEEESYETIQQEHLPSGYPHQSPPFHHRPPIFRRPPPHGGLNHPRHPQHRPPPPPHHHPRFHHRSRLSGRRGHPLSSLEFYKK